MEEAAAKIHEEWRQKKHREMRALGATLPVPQWKRLPDNEYEVWSAALEPDVLAKVHRYCAPQPTNPSAPLDGVSAPGKAAVHWCDIDQPYAYLPESWKATNRQVRKRHMNRHAHGHLYRQECKVHECAYGKISVWICA